METLSVLVQSNPAALAKVLQHCISNELSMSHGNLKMIQNLFELVDSRTATDHLAVAIWSVSVDERGRGSLKPLLRKLLKRLGESVDSVRLCAGLVSTDRQLPAMFENHQTQRWFTFVNDLVAAVIFSKVSSLMCYPDKVVEFMGSLTQIQLPVVTWFRTVVCHSFPLDETHSRVSLLKLLSKALFLEPIKEYVVLNGPDASSDHDKGVISIVCSDAPVDESILTELVQMSGPILQHHDTLELVERLVSRTFKTNQVRLNSAQLADTMLRLCKYPAPALHQVLSKEHCNKELATTELYWRVCLVLVTLACSNVHLLGAHLWKHSPTIRALLECVLTHSWRWPALESFSRAGADGDVVTEDAMIVGAARLAQSQKDYLVTLEGELTKGSGTSVTSQNSRWADTYLLLDEKPGAAARRPPQRVIVALQSLNNQLQLGRRLRQSRDPDLLIETMQAQPANMVMSWLSPILTQEPDTVMLLPIDCLCGLLSGLDMANTGNSPILDKVLQQVRQHAVDSLIPVLKCFSTQLHSKRAADRNAAHKCLALVADPMCRLSCLLYTSPSPRDS
eukprot:TRINITY_DN9194_c0_g1_i4.p1 TRINITY_DN9194_c0_g1~~TRINITY_DN9194_c0_g1_i4.p1  ORF type:complete len:564 (-),score=131.65 TRINITY_DN9194_c0_g1_i4:98-1789(-)